MSQIQQTFEVEILKVEATVLVDPQVCLSLAHPCTFTS